MNVAIYLSYDQNTANSTAEDPTEPIVGEAGPCKPPGPGAYEPHERLAALKQTNNIKCLMSDNSIIKCLLSAECRIIV